jgi:hypothetical protein
MLFKRKKNALDWLYHQAQIKKDINLLQIYSIFRTAFKNESYHLLETYCKATESVAVHSLKISERNRAKFRDNMIRLDGKHFYLFNRLTVWAVGVVSEPDKYIYED